MESLLDFFFVAFVVQLEEPLQEQIASAYLLCRTLDNIEDCGQPLAWQQARFAEFKQILAEPARAQVMLYQWERLSWPGLSPEEAELMTQMEIHTEADCRRAARLLADRTGASVLITRGEHGMWVLDRSTGAGEEAALPASTREVADVTGAGDTVIAVLALALAAGARLVDAARLANAAAGLVVARFGPVTVSADALIAALHRSPA